jgi:hypothetical protein
LKLRAANDNAVFGTSDSARTGGLDSTTQLCGVANVAKQFAYLRKFRAIAEERRRTELDPNGARLANEELKRKISANVYHFSGAFKLIEKHLSNANGDIRTAVEMARAEGVTGKANAELNRVLNELEVFEKKAAAKIGALAQMLREALSKLNLSISKAATCFGPIPISTLDNWFRGTARNPPDTPRNREFLSRIEEAGALRPGDLVKFLAPRLPDLIFPDGITERDQRRIMRRLVVMPGMTPEEVEIEIKKVFAELPDEYTRFRLSDDLNKWPPKAAAQFKAYSAVVTRKKREEKE